MVILLAELDSLHFALFHGEQQKEWDYRWRLVGDLPDAYLAWRESRAGSAFVKVQPELRGGTVEVEWRPAGEEEWRQAALHELVPHRLELEIAATAPFRLDAGTHSAIAVVRDHLARYFFKIAEPVEILPSAPLVVTGHADAPVPANVLLRAGEFVTRHGVLTVRNTGTSCDWSRPCPGPCVLRESPHTKKRKLFAKP